jgi:Cft2 family RNA processing exonuclease
VDVGTRGQGLLLPELRLALDAHAPGYDCLVSHAHGDHIPWEAAHAYASPETADLLALRHPSLRVTPIAWGEVVRIGGARVSLHPAGHILGSAAIRVEAPDGDSLLYTGDTNTQVPFTCPPAELPAADTLVVESTFGLPIFRFPPRAEVAARAVAFARETLDAGATPVFLGYALGKAQELTKLLGDAGVPVAVHGAAWRMAEAYRARGVTFPRARPYVRGETEGAALVVPASFRNHAMVTSLDARVAYASGWALLSRSRAQMDADLLLPLSDHADHPGLLDIVDRVGARKVFANHGSADVFAHLLRRRGLDAYALDVGHVDEDTEDARHIPAAQRRLPA